MVASLTMGIHPAANNGDLVPSITTIYGFKDVQALKRYYDKQIQLEPS
jgi:hypothetical protein